MSSTLAWTPHKIFELDPRYFQIFVLSFLLLYGFTVLRFDISAAHILTALSSALLTQFIASKLTGTKFDARSALISGISLCLLLRSNTLALVFLAGVLAIGVKFAVRISGKHFFNPTNFAIAVLLLFTDNVWVSPGQWGAFAIFAGMLLCSGFLVVKRARRSDITIAFLAFHSALLLGRALRLGDPLTIPFHQLENGALLIFAFFMISDPRTTPDSRPGRVLFALSVAVLAYYLRFFHFNSDALILALFFISPLTPFIDRLLPDTPYVWRGRSLFSSGDRYATQS